MTTVPPGEVLALLLFALLTVVCGNTALRGVSRRSGPVALVLLGTVGMVLVVTCIRPAAIPIQHITALHEGTTARNIDILDGSGAHVGTTYLHWARTLSGSQPPLTGMVRNQIGLAVFNLGLFAAIAWVVLGRGWAALLAGVVFGGNTLALHGMMSETPSVWLTTMMLAGALGGAAFNRAPSGVFRAVAIIQLFLVTLACACTRLETAIVPTLGLAVAVLRGLLGDDRLDRVSAHFRTTAARLAGRPIAWGVGVATASLAHLLLVWFRPHSFNPLALLPVAFIIHPQALGLPFVLGLYFPTAVVILVVLGMLRGFVQWRNFGLSSVGLLSLYSVYIFGAHEGHAYYEMFRYLTMLVPGLLLLGLFGWQSLETLAAKQAWPAWWKLCAASVVVFGMDIDVLHRDGALAGPWDALHAPDDGWVFPLRSPMFLSRNSQIEVRYLLRAMARYPTCEIATRAIAGPHPTAHSEPGTLLMFGGPLHRPPTQVTERELEAARSNRCVLFYQGLDCQIEGRPDCTDITRHGQGMDGMSFTSRWYSEPMEYGTIAGTVRLELFRMRADGG